MIPVRRDKDLGLVHQPAKGLGVDDAVPVALEVVAHAVGRLEPHPPGTLLHGPGVALDDRNRIRVTHAGRRAPVSPRPTREFPGAWARTCERTTLRTFSLGPACRGASRTGVSIRILTLSSVPGASGKASPVCDLQPAHSMPPCSGAKWSGVSDLSRSVPQPKQASSWGA